MSVHARVLAAVLLAALGLGVGCGSGGSAAGRVWWHYGLEGASLRAERWCHVELRDQDDGSLRVKGIAGFLVPLGRGEPATGSITPEVILRRGVFFRNWGDVRVLVDVLGDAEVVPVERAWISAEATRMVRAPARSFASLVEAGAVGFDAEEPDARAYEEAVPFWNDPRASFRRDPNELGFLAIREGSGNWPELRDSTRMKLWRGIYVPPGRIMEFRARRGVYVRDEPFLYPVGE